MRVPSGSVIGQGVREDGRADHDHEAGPLAPEVGNGLPEAHLCRPRRRRHERRALRGRALDQTDEPFVRYLERLALLLRPTLECAMDIVWEVQRRCSACLQHASMPTSMPGFCQRHPAHNGES